MHANNHLSLEDWRRKYPNFFHNRKVLELGSLNINGTVRGYFKDCEYIGIDKQAGRGVDIVVEAKDTVFKPEYFDVIISFSMFEHDPEWKESLKNNLRWLKAGGMLFIEYGAEGNRPHSRRCGGYHIIIPHQEFINYLQGLNIIIIESYFEEDKFGKCVAGAYNILGMKAINNE